MKRVFGQCGGCFGELFEGQSWEGWIFAAVERLAGVWGKHDKKTIGSDCHLESDDNVSEAAKKEVELFGKCEETAINTYGEQKPFVRRV